MNMDEPMLEAFYPTCAIKPKMRVTVTNSDTGNTLFYAHPSVTRLAELPYTLRDLVQTMGAPLRTYCTRNALDEESSLFFRIDVNALRCTLEANVDDVLLAL